jgi:twinkle protein
MRAADLADALARDARAVARHLLPDGKEQNGEWCVGSIAGEPGKSLKVRISGGKAGTWKDFAEDRGGDLLDLWAQARHQGIAEAMREVRDYLGIREPQFEAHRPVKPNLSKPKCQAPKSAVLDWLVDTRLIRPDVIAAYRIGEQGKTAVFPYLSPAGDLLFVKYRDAHTKTIRAEKGGVPCLFGWQAIPADDRSVVLCEGEPDALAWATYGYPALSVPNGATGHSWIDVEFENLQRFDVLYVSFDMDAPGQKGLHELVKRLGNDRCRIVELPHKDVNECLMQGIGKDAIDICIQAARTQDPEELKQAGDFTEEVVKEFWPDEDSEPGVELPWKKAHGRVKLRPGEVFILAGVNGHGKSQMAGNILLDAMHQGHRVCVASMEFRPRKWLRRLTRQACGIDLPSEQYIRHAFDWYGDKLWVFDLAGTAKAARLLEVFRYAARRYGIRFFVVDNLAKCGFDEDDHNLTKQFIDQLTDFAKEFDAHVLLCVHMRKTENENKPLGKMDIKGTGAITDMADTVATIWRNKPKENERRKHDREQEKVALSDRQPFDEGEKPDALLTFAKQRNGEDEPTIALWFHGASFQFLGGPGKKPFRYVHMEDYANVASF